MVFFLSCIKAQYDVKIYILLDQKYLQPEKARTTYLLGAWND